MDTHTKAIKNAFTSELKSDGRLARLFSLFLMVLKGMFSFQLQHILTLLTMAIGSLALSATLFVGEGALKGLWDDLDRLMGNRIVVFADAGPNQQLLESRPTALLTIEDLNCLRAKLVDARYIAPRFFGRAHITRQNKDLYLSIDGISPEMEIEEAFQPVKGRSFSSAAQKGLIFECLLTQSAASYFQIDLNTYPVIGIDGYHYTVVGIIPDPPEADSRFQQRVMMPYFLTQLHWGQSGMVSNIVVAWDGSEKMEATIQDLRTSLDECRAPNAYFLSSSQFKIRKRKGIVSNFITFGTAQSLFCILVAAIGVINVMLANVIKRMREFAIRVAMGAKQSDIVILVLTESFMIGLLGSVIGILAAVQISGPLCALISSKIPEASQLTPLFGSKGIIIPLLVCSLSGLIAGIIPALRAGRIDILSVLRAE